MLFGSTGGQLDFVSENARNKDAFRLNDCPIPFHVIVRTKGKLRLDIVIRCEKDMTLTQRVALRRDIRPLGLIRHNSTHNGIDTVRSFRDAS